MTRLMSLLLVLWVGVTVSTVVDLQKRIIGGRPCGPTEHPYHVILIGSYATDQTLCGGSLISDRWILTAAHCRVPPGWKMTAILGRSPGQAQMEIKAKPEIFKHKDVMKIDRIHDIMLLKLPNPTQIRPVNLPDCGNRPNIGDTVHIAGHGATTMGPDNRRLPGFTYTLQCADLEVVDCQGLRSCLQKNDPTTYSAMRYQHIFCGQRCGVDTCPGDSGGGVEFNDMIYGVHSYTGNYTHACVSASGFMDVCEYIDWINTTIGRRNTISPKVKGCVGCTG